MKKLLILLVVSLMFSGASAYSWYDLFDGSGEVVGNDPSNWTVSGGANTDVTINNSQYVSSPNSMFVWDDTGSSNAVAELVVQDWTSNDVLNISWSWYIFDSDYCFHNLGTNSSDFATSIWLDSSNTLIFHDGTSGVNTGCTVSDETWTFMTELIYLNNDTQTILIDGVFCHHDTMREFGGEVDYISIVQFRGGTPATPKYHVENFYFNYTPSGGGGGAGNTTTVTINSPENITYWTRDIPTRVHVSDTGESTINMTYWYDGVQYYSNETFNNNTWRNTTSTLGLTGLIGLHNFTIWTNASYENFTSVLFTVAGYEEGGMTYDDVVIEGSSETFGLSYRINPDAVNNITAGFWYNGTFGGAASRTTNATHELFTRSYTIPEAAQYNETMTFLFNLTVGWVNGTTDYINSSTNNHTAARVSLTNCTMFNTPTISFFLYNESDDTPVSGNLEIANDVTYGTVERNYSFEWTGISAVNMCIYPNFATYDLESQIEYGATGFDTRTYFIDSQIDNVTETVNLYLLNSSDAEQVIIYVKDTSGIAVEDAIVKIQRFYVGTYSYKTVAQIQTDYDGKGSTYLDVDDVYYRFIIEQNGTVTREFSPTIIVCPSGSTCPPYTVTLYTTESTTSEYSQIYDTISYGCSWNNASGVLSCTGSDSSGLAQQFDLLVEQVGILTNTEMCSSSSTSSAVTLTCTLTNFTGNTYHYDFSVTLSSSGEYLLVSDYLEFYSASYSYGWVGTLTVLLLLLVTFLMAESPSMAIILPTGALVFLAYFGLVPIAYSVIMEIVVIAVVAIYKTRV